jgi:callose synthase
MLTAVLAGFVTFVYLEPLFMPVGMNLAVVALWVLSINSTLVGMSLGVLLPHVFPGICLGVSLALFGGIFLSAQSGLYLPISGTIFGIIGTFLSVR